MTAARFGLDSGDEARLADLGIPLSEAARQLELLESPPPPIRLERPCAIGEGIRRLEPSQDGALLDAWRSAAGAGRLSKFVPASGAASRMFEAAATFREATPISRSELIDQRDAGDRVAAELLELITSVTDLPFFEALRAVLPDGFPDLTAIESAQEIDDLLEALLGPAGLGYESLAKGLVSFHRYSTEARSAFVEHLVEGAAYLTDQGGTSRFHFTVAAEQQAAFEAALDLFRTRHAWDTEVSFSTQDHATDALALNSRGQVARHTDGALVIRPGGHGALLRNLEAAGGDIVFIKNIDNVVPEHRQDAVVLWQKLLGGLLVDLERSSRELQERLVGEDWTDALAAVEAFCGEQLSWQPNAVRPQDRRQQLLWRLDRPLRVCGMVRNEGEPGGGPFWVRDASGGLSRQIVESAQIDHGDSQQAAVWSSSSHFNPVLLVTSLRDRHGRPYRLSDFVDRDAVFVSRKPVAGGTARVLEHPGLWNGAMAHWNTVFVEVPVEVFAPVKTVLDLLRPAHRGEYPQIG